MPLTVVVQVGNHRFGCDRDVLCDMSLLFANILEDIPDGGVIPLDAQIRPCAFVWAYVVMVHAHHYKAEHPEVWDTLEDINKTPVQKNFTWISQNMVLPTLLSAETPRLLKPESVPPSKVFDLVEDMRERGRGCTGGLEGLDRRAFMPLMIEVVKALNYLMCMGGVCSLLHWAAQAAEKYPASEWKSLYHIKTSHTPGVLEEMYNNHQFIHDASSKKRKLDQ